MSNFLNKTYQTRTTKGAETVNTIIELLRSLDNEDGVDGETMQFILEEIGMDYQMLRQLIMSNPQSVVDNLSYEKIQLEK
jgi:predicted butyrate kinase (DUF1464 family)